MTSKDYIALRNHLQTLACTASVWSKEYANLNKRAHIAQEKANEKATPVR